MAFVQPELDNFQKAFNKLESSSQPEWGSMSAQRMVEHLSDSIDLSMGLLDQDKLLIPQDKVDRAIGFLISEHPMPREFKAVFAQPDTPIRKSSLEASINEFVEKWEQFQKHYRENPSKTHLHPYFGDLNHKLWLRMHSKHFTHHFEQFNLT